jgi:hypothetical protein
MQTRIVCGALRCGKKRIKAHNAHTVERDIKLIGENC